MKVILFDIDKTLIKNFKRNGNVYVDSFREVYGCKDDLGIGRVVSHGMTMKQITFEVLTSDGFSEEDIEAKWPLFRDTLTKEYLRLLESSEAYEGVDGMLRDLKERGFELGLVTGNLKEIAMAKLKLAGIDHYFSFGGFGDNLNRDGAVVEAIGEREVADVFLVGDTPLDITAGKKVGVKTVGVTTGVYSAEELKDAGAYFVIDDIRRLVEVLNE